MTHNGNNSKTELSQALNGLLADCYTLFIKTKNFHWHVSGPHFRDYHLLFDEHATEIFAMTDLIAERVRKNGQRTLTSIASIAQHQSIEDHLDSATDAQEMLKILAEDNKKLINKIREVKELAAQAGDNATEGSVDDWTDQAEQRIWFLTQSAA